MAIKKTLQCEKCLCRKETTEEKIKFAQAKAWMIGLGVTFLVFGIAGLAASLYLLNLPQEAASTVRTSAIMILSTSSILGILGLIFTILFIIKKAVASRLYTCPKCGHKMVPVYHHHPV